MPQNRAELDAALLAAHERSDTPALIGLYLQASEMADRQNRRVAAGFYLTHAYVFALEMGDDRAPDLHAQLQARGLEE